MRKTEEGWSSTFLCLTKVPEKTPHSHRVGANERPALTFQAEHGSSLISRNRPQFPPFSLRLTISS